jgi:uncharacterized damage-inducible protein DinB
MQFDLKKSLEILERTPAVLSTMLNGISPGWTSVNEGGESWSVYDIVGHLVHGERTDWIPRTKIILSLDSDRRFASFDREAQFKESNGKSLSQLLEDFRALREENTQYLRLQELTYQALQKKAIHPAFGEVSLSELLATWVVHDLNHIAQISRVMARQYESAVGPWTAYLGILKR